MGGGLLTAVDINLKPVLVNVKEDVELINVEIVKPIGSVNVLNAYVHQEYDPVSSKIKIWQTIDNKLEKQRTREIKS